MRQMTDELQFLTYPALDFKAFLVMTLLAIRNQQHPNLQSLVLLRLIPEFIPCINQKQNRYHTQDVITHSFLAASVLAQMSDDPVLRFASLIHDIGKPQTAGSTPDGFTFYNHHDVGAELSRVICQRLLFPVSDVERIYTLIKHHCRLLNPPTTVSSVRRFVRSLGSENLEDFFIMCRADMLSDCPPSLLFDRVRSYTTAVQYIKKVAASLKDPPPRAPIRNLCLNGNDVMKILQVSTGPEVGHALHILQTLVHENPALNDSPEILTQALLAIYRKEDAGTTHP